VCTQNTWPKCPFLRVSHGTRTSKEQTASGTLEKEIVVIKIGVNYFRKWQKILPCVLLEH
jgi:hypothetical protein